MKPKFPISFVRLKLLSAICMLSLSAMMISCALKTTQATNHPLDNLDNEFIIDLNHLTYTIANEHDGFYSFIGVRALAMTHLAIHDIFQLQSPKYEPYYFRLQRSSFDPVAAAVVATQQILSKAYPKRTDTIDIVCGKWLDKREEDASKEAGIALGKEVADAYITLRENDGHEKQGDYTPMTKPGDYQYTPGFDWVWKPDFSVARPFTLDSVSQFRSPPPPSISSGEYYDSWQEVRDYGSKNSRFRSKDQTHFAHWWAEFGEHGWNRIGRITAAERNLPLVETNRMFALINMNLYDLYLTSFDSKYKYDTWRPYTAIRNADEDANVDTKAEPEWEPEMLTPPWPEYPSAHAATGAAGAEIVTHVYGTAEVSFTMESVTALPEGRERHYDNLDDAADDCADSRIMNGFHFRFATEEGKKQGRQIARHTVANFLKPIDGR